MDGMQSKLAFRLYIEVMHRIAAIEAFLKGKERKNG